MLTNLNEILTPNSLVSYSSKGTLRSWQNPSGAELWTKTRWKFENLRTASGAHFTHFYATNGQKEVAWWGFRPKPPHTPIFTKIGVGVGTGSYTGALQSLRYGLLNFRSSQFHFGGRSCEGLFRNQLLPSLPLLTPAALFRAILRSTQELAQWAVSPKEVRGHP